MDQTDALIKILVGLATLVSIAFGWSAGGKKLYLALKEIVLRRRIRIEKVNFELCWLKDHSNLPMFKLNSDLNCVWVNDALCHLLDTDSSDLLGKVWFGMIKPTELDFVTSKWRKAVEDQSNYTNTQHLYIGGRYRRALVTGDAFIYGGRVREFLGTIRLLDEPAERTGG